MLDRECAGNLKIARAGGNALDFADSGMANTKPTSPRRQPMKPGITAKLFLVILAACAVVVLVNAVAARISFHRGFLGYLNDQGVERMQALLPSVREEYLRQQGWAPLRGNMEAWRRLLRPQLDYSGGAMPSPPVSDQTGALFRFALLDADYALVVGNPDAGRDSILLPVRLDGRTVGWLAMVPFQSVIADGDVHFYEAQLRRWWTIGIASVLIAAVLAWLLSRALLLRLRGLAAATHRLAAGDYATRIPQGTHDELGGLARDFNHLAQALEGTERARRDFMADISHELRTPLAVMRAELEAIQDGIRPATGDSLAALHQQVGQLGELVDDLHDLSLTSVGALAYRFAPLDLAFLLETCLAGVRPRFDAAGLTLRTRIPDVPLRVDGDERRLQQLFANLLENALRYTDAGGSVQVHCGRGDGRVRVVFDDGAPGVEADKLPRLFERFYRTDTSRNRGSGGSGLGLAICRNIVEAHEGRIEAAASPLGGLRIVVLLPEAA